MTSENDIYITDSTNTRIRCSRWMRTELFWRCCSVEVSSWFGNVDNANGKRIDLAASFCLDASASVLLLKLLLFGFVAGSYVYLWVVYQYPYWFMAYLSYWTLFYAVVYLGLSLVTSFLHVSNLGLMLKMTWVMYLVAAVHGIVVVALFWGTEYDPSVTNIRYSTILAHGVSFVLVVVDGVLINKIPFRLCHFVFAFLLGCLFVTWTLIQGLLAINNPKKDGDDESLYSILDWKEKPVASAIVSIVVLLVAFPLFTLLFWGMSLWGRRYVDDREAIVINNNEDEHENENVDNTTMEDVTTHPQIILEEVGQEVS